MFSRLLLALILLLGLAAGPVAAGDCVKTAQCAQCCPQPVADCCAQSHGSQAPPVSVPGVDVKNAVAPVLVRIGTAPLMALPTFAAAQFAATRRPAPPLVARTCVRLI